MNTPTPVLSPEALCPSTTITYQVLLPHDLSIQLTMIHVSYQFAQPLSPSGWDTDASLVRTPLPATEIVPGIAQTLSLETSPGSSSYPTPPGANPAGVPLEPPNPTEPSFPAESSKPAVDANSLAPVLDVLQVKAIKELGRFKLRLSRELERMAKP